MGHSPAFMALAQQVSTGVTLWGKRRGLGYVLLPLGTRLRASSSTGKNQAVILTGFIWASGMSNVSYLQSEKQSY